MEPAAPILVIGSTNTDMVIRTPRFPAPGETLLGGTFATYAGGKGANQAVAAARLSRTGGAGVRFIAKVGHDDFGASARATAAAEGIDTDTFLVDEIAASGVAVITVSDEGENTIVVAPGANMTLSPQDLDGLASAFEGVSYVLMQMETPLPTIVAAAERARVAGVPVILNPAPAQVLPDDLLRHLALITPNETEAAALTGEDTSTDIGIEAAARDLHQRGVGAVVITLGSRGIFVLEGEAGRYVDAPQVTAVDSTAAGDVFNGALVVALAEGQPLAEAAAFACRAAAISVTRAGAQPSIPTRAEVDAFAGAT